MTTVPFAAPSRLRMYTPTYRPVGGVVKIMDYAVHARRLGFGVTVYCPDELDLDSPLFATRRFADLLEDDGVELSTRRARPMTDDELLFVSLPNDYHLAYRRLLDGMSPERLIHIIQNVRHVNPVWRRGHGTRVLTRPAARISINDIVGQTIEPWLDRRSLHRVIDIGHDVAYFRLERRAGLGRPVRVGYTTWKSEIGDRVAATIPGAEFEFRAIRDPATWEELRELYQWCDVFLSSPGAEEGMYLPGLEAMAAGALVITPDVGGNMAYCLPGENCLLVGFESVHDYAGALRSLAVAETDEIVRLRTAAYEMSGRFDLDREREAFGAFLTELLDRIAVTEQGATRAAGPGDGQTTANGSDHGAG